MNGNMIVCIARFVSACPSRSILAPLILFALLALLMPAGARAESDAVCNSYASTAVAQFRENRALSCGLSDGRWSEDFQAHFNWCKTAPMAWLTSEQTNRANRLRFCRREPVAIGCNEYAINANGSQQSNLSGRCGFTGGRWQNNFDAHYNWCLSVPADAANHESNIRFAMLGVCQGDEPFRRCDGYARQAVAQANEAQQRGCLFGGQPPGRWSAVYEDHLAWCIGVDAGFAASEASQREGPLSQCRTTNPLTPVPAAEACAFTARVQNRACLNLDGSASSIVPGSMTSMACGGTPDAASSRAQASFAGQACISGGDSPAAGCCTISVGVSQGCGC